MQILSFGSDVEVVSPQKLRKILFITIMQVSNIQAIDANKGFIAAAHNSSLNACTQCVYMYQI